MTIETVTGETLAAFHAQHLDLAPPEPEVVSEPKPEPIEPKAEGEDPPPPETKPNSKIQNRFSELTAKQRAAEARADAAEAKLREAEAKLAPKDEPKPEPEKAKRPDPETYTDAFKYAEDLAEWTAEQALSKRDQAEKDRVAKVEQEKVIGAWKERMAATKAELPDYDDMVASSDIKVSDDVRDAIIESEHGPRIVYLLASEPELAAKLAGMKPRDQLKEIGRMETRFEKQADTKARQAEIDAADSGAAAQAPTPAPRAKAPAPITPVRGGKTADSLDDDPEFKGTYAEYKAKRLAQMK